MYCLSEIIPSLYVGPWALAREKETLQKYGITHIVNASQIPGRFTEDFNYLTVNIEDDEKVDINQHFTKVSRFINNAIMEGGKVLVHCLAGMSRSPTLVIAYLVQKRNMTLVDAMALVKAKRCIMDINPGFVRQLHTRFTKIENTE
jgi:protein-tyrosine phosphatase